MSKHEAHPFRMVIEGGKLVPATPYDAERLDSYRRGTKVAVRFTEERDRVLVRKWWAVIGLVVKQCQTPWKTKDEASEAIKLALGIVNLTKTIGGDYLAYPKSLTELDDPELQEAVDQMMALVERITGVDPETLRKEIAYLGEDNPQSSERPPSDEGSGEASPSPSPAADLSPDDESGREEGDNPGQVTTEQAAPSSHLSGEDRVWLIKAAKMLIPSAAPGGDPDVVRAQYSGLIKSETPSTVSEAAIAKAVAICRRLVAVCEQTEELDMDLIAGLAGCDVRELR